VLRDYAEKWRLNVTKEEAEIIKLLKALTESVQETIANVRQVSTLTGCDEKKQIKPSLNERLER